jgi:hypothetical protein
LAAFFRKVFAYPTEHNHRVASAASGTMGRMCRNIRPLNNFEPPASRDEVRDAALQYVRKVAGMNKPSKANEVVFYRAVEEIAHATEHLLNDLVSSGPPKNREVEAAKVRARSANRFATA